MPSQRRECPNCGTTNRIYGGANDKRKQEGNRTCSDCGEPLPCPVCQAHKYDDEMEEDRAPPGWFVGESTGEKMPCHFCNIEEMMRQRRQGRRV